MLEVLLFSFSVSIDAIGLSISFGSRNFAISRQKFVFLNVFNLLFLAFFMLLFDYIPFFQTSTWEKVGAFILLFTGLYYIFASYFNLIRDFRGKNLAKIPKFNKKVFSYKEVVILVMLFIVEDVLSTIVFYSNLDYPALYLVATFIFHQINYSVGYSLGGKISKILPVEASFVSGLLFAFLGVFNLMGLF